MVKKADDIAEARDARVESTSTALAGIFWLMVGLTFCAMIILALFVELNAIRIFSFSVQMAAFGALLAVVFIFDQPFNGETSVSPKALSKQSMPCKTGRSSESSPYGFVHYLVLNTSTPTPWQSG